MPTRKAVSALRDDVRELLSSLITFRKQKLFLLDELLRSQAEQRHLLKTDHIGELMDLVELDRGRSDSMDALDADSAALRERIATLCGVPCMECDEYLTRDGSLESAELRRIEGEIRAVTAKVATENGTLVRELEEALANTGRDIGSLGRLIALAPRLDGKGR